jgi:hypothetical protein
MRTDVPVNHWLRDSQLKDASGKPVFQCDVALPILPEPLFRNVDLEVALPNREEVQDNGFAILTCYCCLLLLLYIRGSLYDNQTLSPGSG